MSSLSLGSSERPTQIGHPPPTWEEIGRRAAILNDSESGWRDKQIFLQAHGYMLRPRYRPDWTPSWSTNGKRCDDCEDFLKLPWRRHQIDATRIQDGALVYIKRVKTNSQEARIATMFSDSSRRDDPRNHCVPIWDFIQDDEDPSLTYLVMPFLRYIYSPDYDLVDDIVDLVTQLLEGLAYMHEHGVAHRDCSTKNLMMDAAPLYPRGFHPILIDNLPHGHFRAEYVTRPAAPKPVKYYFIDFGISSHIPDDGSNKLVIGTDGLDQEVPELSLTDPYDPFKVDIFILGNVFANRIIYERFANVEFLKPIVEAMTREDPAARPTAAAVLAQWREIRKGIGLLHRACVPRPRNRKVYQLIAYAIYSFGFLIFFLSHRMSHWARRKWRSLS